MKKKLIILIMLIAIVLPLSSCSLLYPNAYNSATSSEVINQPVANSYEREPDATQIQSTMTDLIAELSASVIGVYGEFGSGDTASSGTGSGVVYKLEGGYYYVITNNHVVYDDDSGIQGTMKAYVNGQYFDAQVLGRDSAHDLAVIKFTTDTIGSDTVITPIDIFSDEVATDSIVAGQSVLAIGSPLGFEYYGLAQDGMVTLVDNGYIWHNAPINPGNSGGGLFNLSGRLIGINFSKLGNIPEGDSYIAAEGMGQAIGIQYVRNQVPKLETGTVIEERPLIGITVSSVTRNFTTDEELLNALPTGANSCLIVASLANNAGSPNGGFTSGLKVGDIIYSFGDEVDGEVKSNLVFDTDDITNVLREHVYGDSISMVVLRDKDSVSSYEAEDVDVDGNVKVTITLTLTKASVSTEA